MNCKQYLKSLEYDEMDSQEVIEVLKKTLVLEEFVPEQILFCVGKILDKNKESYIKLLKKERGELKSENVELKNKVHSLELKLEKTKETVTIKKPEVTVEPPKKKIVVVRKKNG